MIIAIANQKGGVAKTAADRLQSTQTRKAIYLTVWAAIAQIWAYMSL